MLMPSRPRLAVAWVFALLIAPVLAQAVTRLLAAWAGEPHAAALVALSALTPVLLAGAVALATGVARPSVGWLVAGLTGAVALTWMSPLAAIATTIVAGLIAAQGLARLAAIVPIPSGRLTGALWGLLGVVAVLQLGRMSVFMADPTQIWGALAPAEFVSRHSCLSSYVHGAALAQRGRNIYDDRYGSVDQPAELPAVIDIGPLTMDTYEYPPQFLALPRGLLAITADFMAIRALWFLLGVAIFAAVSMALARWLGGAAQRRALLLMPLVWISPPILITAYFGNFQLLAMALSALAMLAIVRGRTRSGAALLAFVISAKIFPGILGIYLLAARRFAAAAWTAAFAALYAVLALLLFGEQPFADFVHYHLPRLASGETFAFLSEPSATMTNFAVFGVPFKLRLIGWGGSEADAWALARPLAWVYTAVIGAVALRAGWRRETPTDAPAKVAAIGGWFGLLALGALRSPFAPPEALIAIVWALALRAAAAERPRQAVVAGLLWLAALIVIPVPGPVTAALSLAVQTLVIATAVWLALGRAPR